LARYVLEYRFSVCQSIVLIGQIFKAVTFLLQRQQKSTSATKRDEM